MAKSKIFVGKCHIALENMRVIFKHLLISISNVIPQIQEILITSDDEIFTHCFMSLYMSQCLDL